jgi:hypothetical protein
MTYKQNDINNINYILEESIWGNSIDKEKNNINFLIFSVIIKPNLIR